MARSLSGPVRLLPESDVAPTGPVDHPQWNYRPVLGAVQRLRFRFMRALLADSRFDRLLEIGYGSGVFMPELATRCGELYGVDPHDRAEEVMAALARNGIVASLTKGSAELLPYDAGFLDCVVAVSSLEYVPDIDAACREIRRVLAPGGVLAVVAPGATPLWNPVLRIATRQGPAQYGDRRQRLLPALHEHFRPVRQLSMPPVGGSAVRLYTGLRLQPR
jgi:SAM-dependent methyltransferase